MTSLFVCFLFVPVGAVVVPAYKSKIIMNKETLTVETDEEGTTTYRNANRKLHNPDGPAIVCANGDKEHWINGKLHNENGPAAMYADGFKSHWIHGKLHNSNGPAIVWANGQFKEYHINGKPLTEAEFTAWQAEQAAK